LPSRLKYAVVAIVVDQFVYIFVLTPYFAESEKMGTLCMFRHTSEQDPQDVNEVCDIDIGEITRELSAQVEHWNSRESGFIIERVKNFVICITKFRPLHGSSYIPTPKHIADKHCTINVKTEIKNALYGCC